MFTLLDTKHFFCLNRSGTTQEGSQGLWDCPQPTLEASRDPKHRYYYYFYCVWDLKSLLPGQGEFDVRIPKG